MVKLNLSSRSPDPHMKLCLSLLLCFSFGAIALGQESAETQPANNAGPSIADSVLRGQPISLFDGKSLDGWEKRNGNPSKNWRVEEDGTLHRSAKGGDLYYQHWFRDFDMTWESKLLENGNSGIKYRVRDYGNRSLGCEYQLQADKGNLHGVHSAGALYGLYGTSQKKKLNPIGQWNSSRIVVCGYHVEHWLNGEKIMTATFGSSDWHRRVAESKFNKHFGFGQNRVGRIFLQDHGNPVWFRNIVLTPLDAEQPAIPIAN